jgi:ketosteroid isomerase-like protein
VAALGTLLDSAFVLIDVFRGSEIPKEGLLAALAAGQVRFESIEPAERRVRQYGEAAIVTGRTAMRIRAGDEPVMVQSRYSLVFVRAAGQWRFVSAQGTPIS